MQNIAAICATLIVAFATSNVMGARSGSASGLMFFQSAGGPAHVWRFGGRAPTGSVAARRSSADDCAATKKDQDKLNIIGLGEVVVPPSKHASDEESAALEDFAPTVGSFVSVDDGGNYSYDDEGLAASTDSADVDDDSTDENDNEDDEDDEDVPVFAKFKPPTVDFSKIFKTQSMFPMNFAGLSTIGSGGGGAIAVANSRSTQGSSFSQATAHSGAARRRPTPTKPTL